MLAIIPAAGFGTRLLPITKAIPKVLLPLGPYPLLHFIFEEAYNAGIREVVIITNWREEAIKWYFEDFPEEAKNELKRLGKEHVLEKIKFFEDANIHFVHQEKLTGLAGAILEAKKFINDTFVVLLGDNLLIEQNPGDFLKKLIRVHVSGKSTASFGVSPVKDVTRVGVIDVIKTLKIDDAKAYLVRRVVEKPKPEEAPSNLGVMGRYVFEPEVLDYLRKAPMVSGELSETDAFTEMVKDGKKVIGVEYTGRWYDIGHPDAYIISFFEICLRKYDWLRNFVRQLLNK